MTFHQHKYTPDSQFAFWPYHDALEMNPLSLAEIRFLFMRVGQMLKKWFQASAMTCKYIFKIHVTYADVDMFVCIEISNFQMVVNISFLYMINDNARHIRSVTIKYFRRHWVILYPKLVEFSAKLSRITEPLLNNFFSGQTTMDPDV